MKLEFHPLFGIIVLLSCCCLSYEEQAKIRNTASHSRKLRSSGDSFRGVWWKASELKERKKSNSDAKYGVVKRKPWGGEDISWESRLIAQLLKRYKRVGTFARPLINSTATIKVEFAVALIQILDFDESNQVLTTSVWKRYLWKDDILRWDPAEYGDVTDIRLPAEYAWVPDIVLYNNADIQEKKHEELLAVYNDGSVRWIPPAIYKSSCEINMRDFPFDKQTCHFKFGSWTYDGNKLDLAFYNNLADLDLREYVESSEWDVLSTSADYHVRIYPCCADEPYPDITFSLTMRRKTTFYIYVLVLPSMLLSLLTLVLFWIPPQRPDRTGLGMSLFSSFFVLLLILVQSTPPTASISLLGVYYCISMILIAFSTMISAIVINLTYFYDEKPMSRVTRFIFLKMLGSLFCVRLKKHVHRSDSFDMEGSFHKGSTKSNQSSSTQNSSQQSSPHAIIIAKQNRIAAEWKYLAIVIDRLFFLIYVIGIILQMIFVFPLPRSG